VISLSLSLSLSLWRIKRKKKMKKMNMMMILRKCKSLSRQLGRSSSYSSLRSKSARGGDHIWEDDHDEHDDDETTIFVGSTRKRYVISSKYLTHPLITALKQKPNAGDHPENVLVLNCEVVLFDHLLWMLHNADPILTSDSFQELADLYVSSSV
jgi:hypothetical protein